jgi:hypothetical protein
MNQTCKYSGCALYLLLQVTRLGPRGSKLRSGSRFFFLDISLYLLSVNNSTDTLNTRSNTPAICSHHTRRSPCQRVQCLRAGTCVAGITIVLNHYTCERIVFMLNAAREALLVPYRKLRYAAYSRLFLPCRACSRARASAMAFSFPASRFV